MKIGIFSISHPLKRGAGASQVSLSIAEYLAEHGNSVEIISISNQEYENTIYLKDIKILTFNPDILPDFSFQLLKHSIFSRYDKVLISGCDHVGFGISIIFLKLKKSDVYVLPHWHHDFIFQSKVHKYSFYFKRFLVNTLVYAMVKPTFICRTQEEMVSISSFGKKFLINQGIQFNKPPVKNSNPKNGFNILMIGRVGRNKIPPYLFDVIKELKKQMPDLTLRIVGKIEDIKYFTLLENHLKSLSLEENVIFEDFVDNDRLGELLTESNLFISLAYSESFGLVVVEALSYGIPTVATRTGIVPFLESKEAVIGVDYGDIAGTVQAILKICEDEELAKNLKKNSQIVEEEFNLERFLENVEKIMIKPDS